MSRTVIELDGEWQFWRDVDEVLSQEQLDPATAIRVRVPGPWQAHNDALRDYAGVAWYARTFDVPIPQGDPEGAWVLRFGAVDETAEVWLNGAFVGQHAGGYLPFELDVSGQLQAGENMVQVRVTDRIEVFNEVPHGKQSWYGLLSGIWQSVSLEHRSRVHVCEVRITPCLADGRVSVHTCLNQALPSGWELRFGLTGPSGEPAVFEVDTPGLEAQLRVPEPLAWDVDHPHLYQLTVEVIDGQGIVQDVGPHPFGFRTIEARDGLLLLNGRPVYLRSVLDQDYYPDLIATPPSGEYIEAQLRQAKAMGLNSIRVHIKIADPRYYEIADRLGLLIWTELPNWSLLTDAAKARASETLARMVARDWNHPSIVIWTLVNESWGIDLTNPEHRRWLVEFFDEAKRLDPHRLIVDNSACQANFHVKSDLDDYHNYYAMPDRHTRWRDWVAEFAGRPWWSYAHAYTTFADWRTYSRKPWSAPEQPPAPEVQRTGREPLIVSEFGTWGLPDVPQLTAQGEPWWFETGHEWSWGALYPHGIDHRFRDFHLRRAFADLSDLCRSTQRLQLEALKYQIEQIRKHRTIQGYVITEWSDVHWECNGLVDMERRPKAVTGSLHHFNADDVLIPDWTRTTYRGGERLSLRLLGSHYSDRDLSRSSVAWHLADWPTVGGVLRAKGAERFGVTDLGKLVFHLPEVMVPRATRLELTWLDARGAPAAHTWHDLYLFPARVADTTVRLWAQDEGLAAALSGLGYELEQDPTRADIKVTRILTDALRDNILAGGRVVWLAENSLARQTYLGGLQLYARQRTVWQGDWANGFSWINQDRLFKDLPVQGVLNFAYADLMPEVVITGYHAREFARDVHAALFIGWLHKTVALIAERRLGRGKLMASTFRLSRNLDTNPLAAHLFAELVRGVRQEGGG